MKMFQLKSDRPGERMIVVADRPISYDGPMPSIDLSFTPDSGILYGIHDRTRIFAEAESNICLGSSVKDATGKIYKVNYVFPGDIVDSIFPMLTIYNDKDDEERSVSPHYKNSILDCYYDMCGRRYTLGSEEMHYPQDPSRPEVSQCNCLYDENNNVWNIKYF